MPYYPSDFRELSISSPACMSAGALGACSRREVREGRKPLVIDSLQLYLPKTISSYSLSCFAPVCCASVKYPN